jgi:hypothetical protein
MSDHPTKVYEEGKDRRYKLLFAVNGGAFAIAKLMTKDGASSPVVLGGLELWVLALAMIVFTAAMVVDIDAFGLKMRHALPAEEVFGPVGAVVLGILGAVLVGGWSLVMVPSADGRPSLMQWEAARFLAGFLLGYVAILVVFHLLLDRWLTKKTEEKARAAKAAKA